MIVDRCSMSGLPVVEYLSDRRWRLILAARIEEALAAMRVASISPAKVGPCGQVFLP